jgi:hypothetical protein
LVTVGTPRAGLHRAARWTGRAFVVVGLALAGVAALSDGLGPSVADEAAERTIWRAGLILAAVGCTGLAALLALWFLPRWRAGSDAGLGFICLVVGVFVLFWVREDERSPVALFLAIVGALLVIGSIALVVAAASSKRFKERWRNTGTD